MTRVLLRLAALALCAAALGGCISLLPKGKPVQLYRFGPAPAASAAPSAARAKSPGVLLANGTFQQEAGTDRILTITGARAAYLADSRWVAPADVLFAQAVRDAFDQSPVRLVARGQQGRAAYALRLDVRSFETRYSPDRNAPVVVVRVHAALARADLSSVGEQDFDAEAPAGDNRVGAIVAAYDKAVGEVVAKLVAWTAQDAG
jgi:cholesterol transport system auxiliary component